MLVIFQVQFLGLDQLPPAEGQQLPGQAGRPGGGLADLVCRFLLQWAELCPGQQRGMALDDGQNIIEIVRNSAGELAYGFHLLRLSKLLFQTALRGNVAEQAQRQLRLALKFDK